MALVSSVSEVILMCYLFTIQDNKYELIQNTQVSGLKEIRQ